ncbi:MAG: hypothetical protein IPI57_20690 [Candidatus Competibacteraceae bacterium]|nr:hypothetical protein [Candidatus Competibacteraceae bacterium]
MTLDKEANYTRQLDDYLMRRLDRMESTIYEMKDDFASISEKLNKIADAQEYNKPPIDAIRSMLNAGGLLKWAVSTIVILCAGFATAMTAWEVLQKWLGK